MSMTTFILVPDSLSALTARRQLAQQNTVGVKVGNFSALLDVLSEYWLLPKPAIDWYSELRSAAVRMPNAFWTQSLAVDERATLSQLRAALDLLLASVPLGWQANAEQPLVVQSKAHPRLQRYFQDIAELWATMQGQRPAEQLFARQWLLEASKVTAITPLRVQSVQPLETLPLWQREIIDTLQAITPAGELLVQTNPVELKAWQSAFISGKAPEVKPSLAASLNFFSARDVIAECRAVASMVQAQIEQGSSADSLAIMLPDQQADYRFWLHHYLSQAGILVSNDQTSVSLVDWQKQLLQDCLTYQLFERPLLQLQSMVVNPVMPWSRAKGQYYATRLAREDMQRLEEDADALALIEQIRTPLASASPQALFDWLDVIVQQLVDIPATPMTQIRMQSLVAELKQAFAPYVDLAFTDQLKRVLNHWDAAPINLSSDERHRLHAVTLLTPEQTLHRPVQQLWVMGFNEGAYEEPTPNSGAIPFEYWTELSLSCGKEQIAYDYPHRRFGRDAWLHNWMLSLAQSQQPIIVTSARQGFDGSLLHPSKQWFTFAQVFCDELKPECLIQPIESAQHPLLRWQSVTLSPMQAMNSLTELQFDQDIFSLITQLNGEARAESPSSLETMMVSPFAWLLNRMGIESREWEVQTLDNALQGTIAHKVFELYRDKQQHSLASADFDALFESAVQRVAPFMQHPQWRIEKASLHREVKQAFDAFVPWLKAHGWTIAEVEQRYQGELWGWAIKGFVDAILASPEQVFIMDYKKSKSDDRLKRLNKGFDLQTYIYRQLYTQQHGDTSLVTGYFNLNDRVMVVDQAVAVSEDIEIKVPDLELSEQSAHAVELVNERFAQLRAGSIVINTHDEAKQWKDRGIKPYAFENTLVSRFMIGEAPLEEEDEQA